MGEEAIGGFELSPSRAREVSAGPSKESMTSKESKRSAVGILDAIWAVLNPYYKEKQSRCSAWGLVWANVFFTICEVFAEWWIADAQGRYVNALQALDSRVFLSSIRFLLFILLVRACLSALNQYLVQWAALRWRTYLTHRFLNKYVTGIAFYRLLVAGPEDVDSPDQRIGEDIPRFCHASMSNLHSIVDGSFKIILFSTVLAQEEDLLLCTLGYAVLGQLILVPWFGRALMRWTTQVLAKEAELRFTLVQVREHAESLAFYQGGARAQREVLEVYKMVLKALYATLRWQALLEVVLGLYKWLADYLPIFWLWTGYFAGDYPLGSLVKATIALQNVLAGTTEILTNLDRLAGWAADSMRLHKLWIALEDVMQRPSRECISIVEEDMSDDDAARGGMVLRLQGLSVVHPRTGGLLCSRLSLELKLGESLLVAGLSGCGKSSLLRAIAGLWHSGAGSVHRVPTARCIFVPQRPYMVRGSLCHQVQYPAREADTAHGAAASSDNAIAELLTSLNLGSLLDRYGLHNEGINWEHTLSVGEQQRLAFARVLWHRPLLAFLDEATSALDEDNEVLCYDRLRDVVGSCVSVGHRRTLKQFHHMMLQSRSDSLSSGPAQWELKRISDLEAEAEEDQFQEEDEDEALDAGEEVAPASRSDVTHPSQHPQEELLPLHSEPTSTIDRMCSPCRSRCERLGATFHHVLEVIGITPCDWQTLLAFICFVAGFAMLVYAIAIVTLRTSFLQRDLQTALKEREEDSYLQSLQLLVPWTIAGLLAGAAKGYVAKWGAFSWRTVITRHMVGVYTKDNKFYRLKMAEGDQEAMIDNPDQRIGQNVAQFCLVGVDLATSSWSTAVQLATLSGLMLVLDQQLFAFAMLWSFCAQVFALECFGGKLVDLTQHVVAQEADFRFALMRIRENSEAIAFYGGSNMEGSQVSKCYEKLQMTLNRRNLWHRIYWQFFRRVEETGRSLVPILLTAPAYFWGQLEYGELMQRAETCTGLIQVSEVVLEHMVSDEESGLASIAVDAVRIQELSKALEGDKDGQSERASGLSEPFLREVLSEQGRIVVQDTLDVSSGTVALRLAGLQVQAPRTGVTLCSALDLELRLGESLLIRGRSGAGKTSILRAIAGLWDRGRGRVERPPPEECAFVPQKPLMIRGSLRQQLIYPNLSGRGASDDAIEEVMNVVRLSNLLNHLGFDATVDWATTLSLGEQQRIAFARTLLQRPRLAFLDEASSGIDRETEKRCYQALQDRTACYISVGHRSTLAAFHTRSLRPPPAPPPGAEPLSARWRLASLSIG